MKSLSTTLAAALLAFGAAGASAQQTEAEVSKVDRPQARVTLKHGGVKSLDMPPMTMVFRVRDPKLLEGVSVGDKVRVDIARIDGQYTVTALSRAP